MEKKLGVQDEIFLLAINGHFMAIFGHFLAIKWPIFNIFQKFHLMPLDPFKHHNWWRFCQNKLKIRTAMAKKPTAFWPKIMIFAISRMKSLISSFLRKSKVLFQVVPAIVKGKWAIRWKKNLAKNWPFCCHFLAIFGKKKPIFDQFQNQCHCPLWPCNWSCNWMVRSKNYISQPYSRPALSTVWPKIIIFQGFSP